MVNVSVSLSVEKNTGEFNSLIKCCRAVILPVANFIKKYTRSNKGINYSNFLQAVTNIKHGHGCKNPPASLNAL
jgi:hypothetical protein